MWEFPKKRAFGTPGILEILGFALDGDPFKKTGILIIRWRAAMPSDKQLEAQGMILSGERKVVRKTTLAETALDSGTAANHLARERVCRLRLRQASAI